MDDVPCGWAPPTDALYRGYHDTEWGVPEHDSRSAWEKFQLDAFQAGLAWITVLRKRESLRAELDGFDPVALAAWDEARIEQALTNPGIIRSRAKVRAVVGNAQVYLAMAAAGEDFAEYLWSWVDGEPLLGALATWRDAPATTPLSTALAKDLKRRGFRFCGPTIVYACLQALGLVNDHEVGCPRYLEIQGPPVRR